MRAIVLTSDQSTELELVDLRIPEPNKDELRIKIAAASVNGFDLAVAGGALKSMIEHRYPLVVGKDFAGVVDAVGAEVQSFKVGDRVFGTVTKDYLEAGSFAEYVVISANIGVAALPDDIDFIHGAALGLAGVAAVTAVDLAEIVEDQLVLVSGASGGVGQQAVQLALNAGAKVIATVGSDVDRRILKELGVTDFIDYTQAVVATTLLNDFPLGADVVFHFAGDPAQLVRAVKAKGKFVSTLLPSPESLAVDEFEQIEIRTVYAVPTTEVLHRVAENQASGDATVTIQETFALADASVALAQFKAGTSGKLVLKVN